MSNQNREIYQFGTFRLDAAERLLVREGERIPLSEKAFDTLCVLVRHANHLVRKDELLSEVWRDAIVEENNLDKNISLLRQVLGERTGEGKFIETVRGHGFRFVPAVRRIQADEETKAVSSEPTLVEARREERPEVPTLASPFNEKESELVTLAPKSELPTRGRQSSFRSFRFLSLVTAPLLLVAIPLGIYFWRRASPDQKTKTIAVLPFKSLVPAQRDEALELGMADALIAKLSEAEEITVRPLSAVRKYDSPDQDSIVAGRALNVEAVLDGSLQTSGDRIRVMARLFRVSDGKQLWASQFDEKFTDIFSLQDSISERVGSALKIRLTSTENHHYAANVEAYQLYMRGRFHALKLTLPETNKAIGYFEQAIKLDPNYALAYLGLARAYLPMALTSGLPSAEVVPKAKAATERAIEIDPSLSEAYVLLGLISFWYDWDWQAAEKYHRRAIDLDPKSEDAHFGYAHLLSNLGQYEKALAEIRLARELDPLSLNINAQEGQILFFARDYDNAIDRLQRTIDLEPNFWLSHLFLSRVYTETGRHAEAVAEAKKAGEISGNSQSEAYRAYALARWGKLSEAREVLNGLLKLSTGTYVPSYNLALAYNAVGERSLSLAHLEKAYSERDVRMVFLKVEPQWDNLRSDERFTGLMKRMGIE